MTGSADNRTAILDAVLVVVSTRGPEALSIRNVAAVARVSIGAVQHHFRTRDALIIGAMTAVNDRFRARVRLRLEAEPSATGRVRIFCEELACATDTGTDLVDAIVWTAFAARASTDAGVRAIHAEDWALTESAMLRLLTEAHPDSGVTPDDAALLLAVLDGIAVARAAEQSSRMTTSRAITLIDAALASITGRVRAS